MQATEGDTATLVVSVASVEGARTGFLLRVTVAVPAFLLSVQPTTVRVSIDLADERQCCCKLHEHVYSCPSALFTFSQLLSGRSASVGLCVVLILSTWTRP